MCFNNKPYLNDIAVYIQEDHLGRKPARVRALRCCSSCTSAEASMTRLSWSRQRSQLSDVLGRLENDTVPDLF